MILITGAGTLLGKEISHYMVKKNNKVLSTYYKSSPKKFGNKKLSYFSKINLENKITIKHKISSLIHCASIVPADGLSENKTFTKNIKFFNNLLKVCKKNSCKNIVLISTISVYGKFSGIINEKTRINPIDAYAKSKLEIENILKNYCKKNRCNFFILRIPVLLGEESKNNFLSVILKKILNDKKIVFSNPNIKLNTFIHVKTIAKITEYLFLSKFKNLTLNLCAKNNVKLKKVIDQIYSRLKKKRNYSFSQNTEYFNISTVKLKKYKIPITSMKQTINLFLDDNV